jgi:hypothetical protein
MAHDPLFDSAWFKWGQAIVHTQALAADIRARGGDGEADPPFGFWTKYEPKRHGISVVVGEIEPIPVRWGLLLGDIANNYRAALDHLAWALVTRGQKPPGTGKLTRGQEKSVYFPIYEYRAEYNAQLAGKLPGVRRADAAKVRGRQPYHYGARARSRHALVLLAGINSGDKHRTIQPVWEQPTRVDIEVTDARDCTISNLGFRRNTKPLQVGTELAFIRTRKTGDNPDIDVKLNVAAMPSLNNRISIRDWLTACGGLIFNLLREFSEQPPGINEIGAHLVPFDLSTSAQDPPPR